MEINYSLVFLATLLQFILGALWYSPLMFGKIWMQVMEVAHLSKEELANMQKEMMPFYFLQLVLTLFTTFNFFYFIQMLPQYSSFHIAFWVWSAFIAPIIVQTVVWGNTKRKYWVKQLSVSLSFQLVAILIAALVLSI